MPLFKRLTSRKLVGEPRHDVISEDMIDEVAEAADEAQAVNPIERTGEASESTPDIPAELPLLPLRGVVVYPSMWLPLTIGQPRSIRLIDEAVTRSTRRMIGLVTAKDAELEEPGPNDIYHVGVAAIVHRLLKAPDGTIRLIVQGVQRIHVEEYVQEEPYLRARVTSAPDQLEENVELEALSRNAVELFRRLVQLVPHLPEELEMAAINADDATQLCYIIAGAIRLAVGEGQRILEIDSVRDKLLALTNLLNKELEVLELGRKIQSEAQGEMEKMQRDYFLREQLKAIQKELGEGDEQAAEIADYERRIAEAHMPEEAEKEARREVDRLRKMPTQAAEYSVIKTYLDILVTLPWQKGTDDNLEIRHARQVLDEDHYALEKVKERILETLAVRKLRQERKPKLEDSGSKIEDGGEGGAQSAPSAPQPPVDFIRREREGVILCFVGPPGVGKTSLGQSIARAMGRKFIRLSLGGVRDEAEIRGFRRTYVGSQPGRVIQALRRVESRNPIFMLDEIDKLGMDYRGDPASALLEVLDPEQNREFRDHYLDVSFDLSQVMFITTANLLDPIPAPLRDRMEIIHLSGYTEEEKMRIAQGYLMPRQIKENGLRPEEVNLDEGAVRRIVRDYTMEAGVRNLEREIGTICRKIATKIAEGSQQAVQIHADDVPTYLGKARFYAEVAERTEVPGVATGLSVSDAGGHILFIEATRMPGNKGFVVTGQLGEVMKESAQAALSYVRNKSVSLNIDPKWFDQTDIHLHIPAGSTPKDGPSAGVTMATALASLLTRRKVRSDVAMTGEITLRGQVLPVGGIKDKVLAASRAGLTRVILPARNQPDLDDIPQEVREKTEFILADRVDEVFAAALEEPTLEQATQPVPYIDGKQLPDLMIKAPVAA